MTVQDLQLLHVVPSQCNSVLIKLLTNVNA